MTTERRSTRKQKLSRREVLKALAAIGGAAAASVLLPEKWIEPVVEAGVLPAHAQSSIVCEPPYAIVGCAITDYSWRDHHNFDFTIRADLNSHCAGIPLRWAMEILDADLERIAYFDFENSAIIQTQSLGDAVHRVGDYISDDIAPYLFSVTWKFANLSDGTGTCTSTLVFPPRP